MKICSKCKEMKSFDQFHKSEKRGYQSYCLSCRKQHDKQYWEKRKTNLSLMEAKRKSASVRREKAQDFVYKYLLAHPCIDCGEKDPIVLTFDHIFHNKLYNVSDIVSNGNMCKLQTEIVKCVVRCANCHMRKTAKDFNWFAFKKARINGDGCQG